VLSFTAQAFLFTIALGSGDDWAKLMSSYVSLIVTSLSITLMARHRQTEIADSELMARIEKNELHLERFEISGKPFQLRRERQETVAAEPMFDRIPRPGQFRVCHRAGAVRYWAIIIIVRTVVLMFIH